MKNNNQMTPKYLHGFETGQLKERIKIARRILASCELCPRMCRVNRLKGVLGVCKAADRAIVSSYQAHFGEEAPLVGRHGSGTIFFTNCNLRCNFCQNFEISHGGEGNPVSSEGLAEAMLSLQNTGCHNINFVTPTHVVPQILESIEIAISNGLRVPLVYNSSGYDRVETLKLLDGIIDIYMPDFKFWDSDAARVTCQAPDYPEVARQAIKEMHRQVGELVMDDKGLAVRGLLVRHLVLPKGLAGTREIMKFIVRSISPNTYVNIMSQYRPFGNALEMKPLNTPLPIEDFRQATEVAKEEGVLRLDPPIRRFLVW